MTPEERALRKKAYLAEYFSRPEVTVQQKAYRAAYHARPEV